MTEKYKLSVSRFRKIMCDLDVENIEEMAAKHAYARHLWKKEQQKQNKNTIDTIYDIEHQKSVLERMIKRGCKDCERKRQEKWIQSLTK